MKMKSVLAHLKGLWAALLPIYEVYTAAMSDGAITQDEYATIGKALVFFIGVWLIPNLGYVHDLAGQFFVGGKTSPLGRTMSTSSSAANQTDYYGPTIYDDHLQASDPDRSRAQHLKDRHEVLGSVKEEDLDWHEGQPGRVPEPLPTPHDDRPAWHDGVNKLSKAEDEDPV